MVYKGTKQDIPISEPDIFSIKDGKLSQNSFHGNNIYLFQIRQGIVKKANEIDLVDTRDMKTCPGIFKTDKDGLYIVIGTFDGERPTSFDAEKNKNYTLYKLVKLKK